MDDWARLEIVCARKGTVGSNPTLSASLHGRALSEMPPRVAKQILKHQE